MTANTSSLVPCFRIVNPRTARSCFGASDDANPVMIGTYLCSAQQSYLIDLNTSNPQTLYPNPLPTYTHPQHSRT